MSDHTERRNRCIHCGVAIRWAEWDDNGTERAMYLHRIGDADDGRHRFCKAADGLMFTIAPAIYAVATPQEVAHV